MKPIKGYNKKKKKKGGWEGMAAFTLYTRVLGCSLLQPFMELNSFVAYWFWQIVTMYIYFQFSNNCIICMVLKATMHRFLDLFMWHFARNVLIAHWFAFIFIYDDDNNKIKKKSKLWFANSKESPHFQAQPLALANIQSPSPLPMLIFLISSIFLT